MTAPYVPHPDADRAILELAAPEWDPSLATVSFLTLPGETMDEVRAWAAEVHRRGICDRCREPITWTPKPRLTCTGKCRKRRSRARSPAEVRMVQQWDLEHLIRTLYELEYPDWERRERHQRYLSILDGTYRGPPRLGPASTP